MKKILFGLMFLCLFALPVRAAFDYVSYQFDIVDARGKLITDANFTITIYDDGTTFIVF